MKYTSPALIRPQPAMPPPTAFCAPTSLPHFFRSPLPDFYSRRMRMISSVSPNPARTALITGASGGIGAATAKALVSTLPNLSHLLLCARNLPKTQGVAAPLKTALPDGRQVKVSVLPLELASVSSVKQCAEDVKSVLEGNPLDLMICNAGIMAPPLEFVENTEIGGERQWVKIESQFFVNHLSHALLLDRIVEEVKKGGEGGKGGRILFVSSTAVSFARSRTRAPLIADKVEGAVNKTNYERWKAYGDSKLAMSLYAKALAERDGLESVSLHPGVVRTELQRYVAPWTMKGDVSMVEQVLGKAFSVLGLKTPEQGAELSVELGSGPWGGVERGSMYVGKGRRKMAGWMIPLLTVEKEWQKVYDDTQNFVRNV
eukprot:GFKZ01006312.1.p1 GENE.GFKZ01006312.1~~GFKZ01006312.1.p1  ORF type:complete len:373 (+),score=48.51 GFKZ01006312.1:147-1265(+)